jgi:hypothetical protein
MRLTCISKKYFKALFFFIILFCQLRVLATAKPTVSIGKKHMVLLTAQISGEESAILGSYYFGVFNNTDRPQEVATRVILPNEAIHFEADQGISNEDIYLGDDGVLKLKKIFPPGMTLVGVGFKVPVNLFYNEKISFKIYDSIAEFTVATALSNEIKLVSKQLSPGLSQMLATGDYQGVIGYNLKKGASIDIEISGIPKNKYLSWLLVLIAGVMSILIGGGLAVRSQRQLNKLVI